MPSLKKKNFFLIWIKCKNNFPVRGYATSTCPSWLPKCPFVKTTLPFYYWDEEPFSKNNFVQFFHFKACVRYFLSSCYFSPNDSPSKNYKNCFLFYLKSSFHSRDIQIFVFLSSPLFLPVSHCFRGCSKINLKVYDVINCLNKNLVTHFVWYPEKEKRYDKETLSIDRVSNKEQFYGKIM